MGKLGFEHGVKIATLATATGANVAIFYGTMSRLEKRVRTPGIG